jgi:hypothetical protein
MLLGMAWIGFWLWPGATNVDRATARRGLVALALALGPAMMLNAGQSARLFEGLAPEEFRLLSVELQGPQHMLPHLWRFPQWLAWACYPILALLSLGQVGQFHRVAGWPAGRLRLALLLAINLAGIGLAWVGVEVVHDLRLTVFQPFRMATVLRGLAIVAVSGRVLELWRRGNLPDRARALLLTVGLDGDWTLVVATSFEITMTILDVARSRGLGDPAFGRIRWGLGSAVLGLGLGFLARHDTESGQIPMIGSLVVLIVGTWANRVRAFRFCWNRRRLAWALFGAWAVPVAALIAGSGFDGDRPWVHALVDRCRFAAVPTDDVERLAVWCRDHTPVSAHFIGPPGPKTFRLWSLRSLAFNRAGSPYHASALADWSARFRDHVGFSGSTAAFVHAYLADRHGLERRYQALTPDELAELAIRQGATHVVASPFPDETAGSLQRLHVEGRYAVYRVMQTDRMSHREDRVHRDR